MKILRSRYLVPVVALAFAGCGGNGSGGVTPTPVATASATATAAAPTSAPSAAASAAPSASGTPSATAAATASATPSAAATATPSAAATTAPAASSTAFAVTTIAGSGGNASVDGTGLAATFANPVGITYVASAQGDPTLFVTDQGTGYLRGFDMMTGAVTTYDSTSFNAGSVYGLNSFAGTIGTDLFIDSGTGVKLISLPTKPNPATTPGPAGSALGSPATVAVDSSGDLYTTGAADGNFYELLNNQTGHVAVELGSALPAGGNYGLAVTGSVGSVTAYFTDQTANSLSSATTTPMMVTVTPLHTGAPLNGPAGMVLLNGSLYIANCSGNDILKATTAGVITVVAGGGMSTEGDGYGIGASFDCPFGIATDGTDLYVTDMYGNTIRKIANVL